MINERRESRLRRALHSCLPGFVRKQWARIDASPFGSRLARGAFWSLAGALASRGLTVLASVFVARILGKGAFGELGIVQSTVGMFGTFAGFGLGLTATKYVAEFREKDPARAGRVLAMSGIVAWTTGGVALAALALGAPWLAAHTLSVPRLADVLRIGSLLVLLGAVNGAQTGALAGYEAFKRIAVISVWSGLASFPLMVVGCWLWGLEGAVAGQVAALAVNCILNRVALSRESKIFGIPLWSPDWIRERAVLWRFSLPTAVSSIMVSPVYWIVQTWLVKTSGYEAQAEYAVGAQWRMLAVYLPSLMLGAYLPVLASIPSGQVGLRVRAMHRAVAASLVLVLPFVMATWLLAPFLLPLYGESFADGLWVLRILLLASVADAVNNILVQTMLAAGEAWWRLASNGLWALLTIVLALWWIPTQGAAGMALALAAGQGVHLLLQYLLARVVLRRTPA